MIASVTKMKERTEARELARLRKCGVGALRTEARALGLGEELLTAAVEGAAPEEDLIKLVLKHRKPPCEPEPEPDPEVWDRAFETLIEKAKEGSMPSLMARNSFSVLEIDS
eukprot:COSAG04_NODE_3486_length_2778_cov_34.011818_3_plen_110_part_01